MSKTNLRNIDIDVMKAIAIIAVVFYHLDLLPFGYLGVDIFLVINGFLITKGLRKSFAQGTFSYWNFIVKRLIRLWPLVIIASAVSLAIGYITMLPDDLENLCQSIFASNIFANNILSCITTADYWNASNAFKPLMHMWYLGIVVQFYLLYPLAFMIANKWLKAYRNGIVKIVSVLSILSLLLYLIPSFTDAQKFYYLPFRFFEMSFGGLLTFINSEKTDCENKRIKLLAYSALVLCLIPTLSTSKMFGLLVVNILTALLLIRSIENNLGKPNRLTIYLSEIGKASYSIYVWHQVIYAFYKYAIKSQLILSDYCILLVVILATSVLSYLLLEKPISKYCSKKPSLVFLICVLSTLSVSAYSLWLYDKAGVVRDVPELGIIQGTTERGMYAKYCDRVYDMQRDFQDNGKPKIIAIGDSYARDMVNVLLESEYADSVDITYAYAKEVLTDEQLKRVKQADVILVRASYAGNAKMRQIQECATTKHIFGISNKEYGETNGNEYQHRNRPDYYNLRAAMASEYLEDYLKEKAIWGDRLIDFVEPVADDNYNVLVFTPDHKFISQDCRHLTQAGAKFYADLLNIKRLVQYK